VIERQLNGEFHQSFDAAGLEVTLRIPLTHERWPTPLTRDDDLP
jgi:hypothetical protein